MALPINPNKITSEVKTNKWLETITKSFGASGQKMTEKEAVDILRKSPTLERIVSSRSTSHMKPMDQKKALEMLGKERGGYTPNIKSSLGRELPKLQEQIQPTPTTLQPKKQGFLSRLVLGRKNSVKNSVPSGKFNQMSQNRRMDTNLPPKIK